MTGRRDFSIRPAQRRGKPVYFGVFGASGSGKTYSALRVAKGIQSVVGGKIVVIDTENGRALDYADLFEFEHLDFQPPFGSDDYLEAFNTAVASGASVVVIDSMSHEHEGEGGMLEAREEEWARLGGKDSTAMLSWSKPKAARRRLRAAIARSPVHLVCAFRAKEGAKPVKNDAGKTEVIQTGFRPIAGDEFVYEMTAACLLLPAAGGVPTWKSDFIGERTMLKLPTQFRKLFEEHGDKPLDESVGRALAEWAGGGVKNESRAPAGNPPDRGQTQGGTPPAGARTDSEAQDPVHAEALEAVREILRSTGTTRFPAILSLAKDAGVDERRVTACWDGPTRSLHLERLSLDELTMIVDHHERKQG